MKKLIVCDMSGIASTRGKNNDELLNVLNNLKNYNCTFCTGKGYSGGYETLKDIDLKVPFICENGSVLVNKDGKIVFNEKMNSYDVIELIKNIVNNCTFEFLAYVDLNTHKYKFLRGTKKLTEDLNQPWFYSEEIYTDVNDFINNIDIENICRITTRGLSGENNIDNLNKFHVVISEKEFHSICSIGVNKGSGIKKLAKYCNISLNDIIIIGNDMNDIDMFKLDCGLKIATGNEMPPKELLNLSNIYIPLNDLPKFIEKFDKNKN